MEKVSIVIPVYNTEKYLAECIESALDQTYEEIEIIAVDDGSTDNSPNILKKYSDRIKIISKENGGQASALNVGIMAATGEWIKQLDSDDILYHDAVEALVSETKNFPEKRNTIFYANWDTIDSNGKIIGRHLEPNYNNLTKFDLNVILLDNIIGTADTSLIHKSAFDRYGYFDETINYHEDYELRLRYCLVYNCRMHFIPKRLAKYRIHQTSKTWTRLRNSVAQNKMIRKSILEKIGSDERHKYESSLVKYQKSKPIISRISTYARYNIMPYLPRSLYVRVTKLYLSMKS